MNPGCQMFLTPGYLGPFLHLGLQPFASPVLPLCFFLFFLVLAMAGLATEFLCCVQLQRIHGALWKSLCLHCMQCSLSAFFFISCLVWLLSRIYWVFSTFLTYVGVCMCIFHPAFIIQTVIMQISSLRHLQLSLVCVFFEAHQKNASGPLLFPLCLEFKQSCICDHHHNTTLSFRIFCSCFEKREEAGFWNQ